MSCAGSCHNLTQIGKAVRHYLNCEWQRKLDEVGKPSVAASWAEDHPGVKHDFNANTIPGKRPKVPNQDNWWDCGLFALAYMDFWTHAPPGQVEICAAGAFQGKLLWSIPPDAAVSAPKCADKLRTKAEVLLMFITIRR